jgi:hypothetical protein
MSESGLTPYDMVLIQAALRVLALSRPGRFLFNSGRRVSLAETKTNTLDGDGALAISPRRAGMPLCFSAMKSPRNQRICLDLAKQIALA